MPAKGDTVTLMFDGANTAWLLLTSSGGDLSFSGSYTYAGSTVTLTFTASGFSRHGSFHFVTGQSSVTLPFQCLSAKPGTSRWDVEEVDPMGGAMQIAIADVAQTTAGVTPASLVEAAAAYVSAATGAPVSQDQQFSALESADAHLAPAPARRPALLALFSAHGRASGSVGAAPAAAPGALSDAVKAGTTSFRPMKRFNPMIDGIEELPDGLELQASYGATVTMPFLEGMDTPGSTGELLKPDGTFSNTLNINKSPPSPHNGKSDPTNKTALFFLPFQGTGNNQHFDFNWVSSTSGRIVSVSVQKFFDPYIPQEESILQGDGYRAPKVLTGSAATVFALIKALKKDPGVVYYETHGGPDGGVLTGDFLGNTVAEASGLFLMFQTTLHKMGAPNNAVGAGAPPISGASRTYNAIYLKLLPPFWLWLHASQGVDLTHSLVYLSACDSDASPELAEDVGARALFAYDVDVEENFSNAVGLYLIEMLAKKSFTAEEAYYNMLLIDETGTTVYTADTVFNGTPDEGPVFKLEQRVLKRSGSATANAEERAREGLAPQPNQPKSDIYNVLDAYGTKSYGDPVPYIGQGWLSDKINGGAVFYLLVAARAPATMGTIKQGLHNLQVCWNAWWSKGKLPGISSTYCQQAVPGYAPSPDEYWYARYLLSGKQTGFSGTYVPRFTLNDGS